MSLENLDNLVKIGKLKTEPPDQKEFDGMVSSAKRRLKDAAVDGLSEEGAFFQPMARHITWLWRRFDGTGIVPIVGTLCFNVWNKQLVWKGENGACWTNAIISGIWRNMKGI